MFSVFAFKIKISIILKMIEMKQSERSKLTDLCARFCATIQQDPTGFDLKICLRTRKVARLRDVPHFSSGIVERAKRERVKITRARVSLALLSLRTNEGLLAV